MKRLSTICFIAIYSLFLFSCKDDRGAKFCDVQVEIMYPEGYEYENKAGISVSMNNMLSGVSTDGVTNEEGISAFAVEGGTYNISASFETEDFFFNGILENRNVQNDEATFEITLSLAAKGGGLVISEIYHAGSMTPENTIYYGDQYIEIYNNSDEVIYLDGLCMGSLGSSSMRSSSWVDVQGNLLPVSPIGITGAFMIPGQGEDYPLEPRTAAVIAATAINHQSADANPNSPVNLSNAAFEAYVEHPTHHRDIDNPDVPNLIMMYPTPPMFPEWMMGAANGGFSKVIWRLPTGLDYETIMNDPNNYMYNPASGAGLLYFVVKHDWVIDAVENVRVPENHRHKQLPVYLDAGMIWNEADKGHSIRRKVDKIIDGKVFLMDVNNSSIDFIGSQIPNPGQVPSELD